MQEARPGAGMEDSKDELSGQCSHLRVGERGRTLILPKPVEHWGAFYLHKPQQI